MNNIDELNKLSNDLVIISKFAINGSMEDARLYVARMVRKYRTVSPEISISLGRLLEVNPKGKDGMLRQVPDMKLSNQQFHVADGQPAFLDGPLVLPGISKPIFSLDMEQQFRVFLAERARTIELKEAGLRPTCSLFFTGKPGLGKTMSAYWLAETLGLPLYKLDLATVVSSFLGQTGNNLQTALKYAKVQPMVLLLDEIDALAKKRNDDFDVGEIKRIVTVLLQEIDNWPQESVLIAATNHPELVDVALWRRFDYVFTFQSPGKDQIQQAVKLFFAKDYDAFCQFDKVFCLMFEDMSFADIERQVMFFRRSLVIGDKSPQEIVSAYLAANMKRKHRIDIALHLMDSTQLSQYEINKITGVSRDTLRKYRGMNPVLKNKGD